MGGGGGQSSHRVILINVYLDSQVACKFGHVFFVGGLLTCSSAATMYIESTGSTAPFIVMETDIFSSGMPSNKICSERGENERG